jgi:hypothetical protein
MTRKGGKGFTLPEIGKGSARDEGVRRTARAFFSEGAAEVEAAAPQEQQHPPPAERGRATAPHPPRQARAKSTGGVDSSRGRDSSRRVASHGRRDAAARRREESAGTIVVDEDEAGTPKAATWRAPREDGRLRSNDRAVLDYLRGRVLEGGETTEPVGMKEIAGDCGISLRTAQNTVLRLQQARYLFRLPQEVGSNTGCRYRISPLAPARFRRG